MSLRLAYMTAIYPRATDTFIQREVGSLRGHGAFVQTFSVRKPAEKEIIRPEQQSERRDGVSAPLLPDGAAEIAILAALWQSQAIFQGVLDDAHRARRGAEIFLAPVHLFRRGRAHRLALRRQGLVHLHTHFSSHAGTVAMLAAELGGTSYSLTIHGPAEFFDPVFWRMDEKVRRAKFIACISQYCRSQVMVFAAQDDWQKLHIVHCGVDPSLFAPAKHYEGGPRLLFVGRLAAQKGLPILLDAIAELKLRRPDVRLTVAGDGPDRQRLVEQVKELGIESQVEFVGYQSQQQVRELLANTDVFVMSSFAEGVPVVLMEAMAAGVPVVATRIAGVPELVEDGVSGYLVPPGDAKSVAQQVERLLADPALRSAMGAKGREKVEREFNMAIESEKLYRVMAEALHQQASESPPSVAAQHVGRALSASGS